VAPLADRHYSRQKIGSPQFVPPGRCVVLHSDCRRAFWVTSWPFAEYVKHAWGGAWICSAFRSENAGNATELITDAVAATRAAYGESPQQGMVTFIDSRKVEPIMTHGVPSFGRTWVKAGFKYAGKTAAGLLVFQLQPADMPLPSSALPRNPFPWPVR
jgi:hypothetical protein